MYICSKLTVLYQMAGLHYITCLVSLDRSIIKCFLIIKLFRDINVINVFYKPRK
jgi:hypothetical protein